MSFPTVNGMLIDTEEDTNNKPTANVKGFLSGFAKATILRNDDALWLSFDVTANIRDHNERFCVGDVGAGVLYVRRDTNRLTRGVGGGVATRGRNPE